MILFNYKKLPNNCFKDFQLFTGKFKRSFNMKLFATHTHKDDHAFSSIFMVVLL